MTFTELTELSQDYLENEEAGFVANLPSIIEQAEARIYNSIRTPDQRKSFSASVAVQTFTTPLDFIEPQALYVAVSGSPVPLLLKQASFIRTAFPSGTGTPGYYAIQTASGTGATIMLGPTPDGSYVYTLDYFGNPAGIEASTNTWLSNNFPDALLYGTLLEGYVYMKGEKDMRDTFQERFDRSMAALKLSSEVLVMQDEYRTSPIGAA